MAEENGSPNEPAGALPIPRLAADAMSYWVDAWQRTVLFWDVLRERGNMYLQQQRQGARPVLAFDYDLVADARRFERPANYALARIKAPAEHPTDPTKRPFVVIDPRVGQGAGSGGSSVDSEIGIALRAGHPCYFVMFFPDPLPDQSVEAIARAEAAFLREVNALHPKAEGKPFVIGNCQGGWALMLLAAAAPDLVGPVLLAGSPVSYWADGDAPVTRQSGGLVNSAWLTSLATDLGKGGIDAAQVAANFARLSPVDTYWTKLYNLYANVDTEGPRLLDFERSWGSHFQLNREEIDWITQNLFIGDQFAAGKLANADGALAIDLRNVRSPIVVFASSGDPVTPPQQALGWIADLYESELEIAARRQVIVYCLHDETRQLGLFVSTHTGGPESDNAVSALDLIDTLPPGLYEAVIDETRARARAEGVRDHPAIRFEPRKLAELVARFAGPADGPSSDAVKRIAEVNQRLYDAFVSPWVKAMANETTAKWLRLGNPDRVRRYLLSDLNPAMWTVKSLAQMVRAQRRPAPPDNALAQIERQLSDSVERTLDAYRDRRDAWLERVFRLLGESPWIAAAVGHHGHADPRHAQRATAALREELTRLIQDEVGAPFESGTPFDAWVRVLIWQGMEDKVIDERPFNLIQRLGKEQPAGPRRTLAELKEAIRQQMFVLLLDEQRAIAALPRLMPDRKERARTLELARRIASAKGPLSASQEARFRHIEQILSLPTSHHEAANG